MKHEETSPVQITFRVRPDGDIQSRNIAASLVAELTDSFEEVDVIEVITGPHYTQIPARCPDCHAQLCIDEISTDGANGASGPVRCQDGDCDWMGVGEYRLIDIFESEGSNEMSLAASGRVLPRYFPY